MNLPFLLLLRGLAAPRSISFADEQLVPWEILPINTFFGEFTPQLAKMRICNRTAMSSGTANGSTNGGTTKLTPNM